MGRLALQHIGGTKTFSCTGCKVFLTNRRELVSTRFKCSSGRAFLFNKVVNVTRGKSEARLMRTGKHIVRVVSCKRCKSKLGLFYDFVTAESLRYKESRTMLECAKITESEEFDDQSTDKTYSLSAFNLTLFKIYGGMTQGQLL